VAELLLVNNHRGPRKDGPTHGTMHLTQTASVARNLLAVAQMLNNLHKCLRVIL
jgi:hypothetical protein